ncbi:MAG TPA: hypothetical protein VFY93_03165 [Planctomycetota bacterium]|nr:hypothetical protein [Planctomycetota bacterium]
MRTRRRRGHLARRAWFLLVLLSAAGAFWCEAWLLDRALAVAPAAGVAARPPRAPDTFFRAGEVAAIALLVVVAALLTTVTALSFQPAPDEDPPSDEPAGRTRAVVGRRALSRS